MKIVKQQKPVITLRTSKLPHIKTERLVLRDIQLEDISTHYINWLNNPEVTKYLEVRFTPQTRETVAAYVSAKLADTVSSKHFGVYERHQGEQRLIGSVTLGSIDLHHASAAISFVIGHPEAQGKGYATEAIHAAVFYMFNECNINKLWAGYYDGHHGSANALAKNGFVVEGRLKKKFINADGQYVDHVLVGLLAEDYGAFGC
ncbi:MAG: ribosomal-protein-alanine N-acetyltransferase [Phenylobacterium sp.]|jgi:ribosomal-protein-alanine N-acetyltransferase